MADLNEKIEQLPKIGKSLGQAFNKLGIETARDLLFYFPFKYLDFSKSSKIKSLRAGENVTIEGKITTIQSRFSFKGRMALTESIVSDDSGSIKVVWFNQPYLAKSLKKGDKLLLAGAPEFYKTALQLTNPIYEKVSELNRGQPDFPVHTSRLVPVYRLSQKIYPKAFRSLTASVIHLAEEVEDPLPVQILKNQDLPNIAQTIRFAHFPENPGQISSAKKRLAFEEVFLSQLLAQKHKMEMAKKASHKIKFNQKLVKGFISTLPFQLTAGQKKAAWDVLQDMEKKQPMNRLLEGDVGSGKTLVAIIAALETINAGLQAAILAPTEILAKQHYETAKKYLRGYKTCLLTGHYSEINSEKTSKSRLLALAKEGMPGIYIGTHSLLEEKVSLKNLGLAIVDEQHRFGVKQRSALTNGFKKPPHLLSLSATPIPRTLQLAFYGELDISQIKTKPPGRLPILTRLVHKEKRADAYGFIKKQLALGRQAFVITPLIEESDKLGVKAAKTEAEKLQKVFPEYAVGLLHGRLKTIEKEQAMAEFLAAKTAILVSTSVVEVGVDVPNASVMVIEGAERFGLAQLHQFRGRVGRSDKQSYCLLFSESENEESLKRLEAFSKTSDGFALAELDLKLRGFGELYGQQQSGWNFKYFSPAYISLIQPAREEAQTILSQDFGLESFPLLKEKIKGKNVHFE